MGRMVRMSTADAIAAGLLDPEVEGLLTARGKASPRNTKPRSHGVEKTQDDPARCGSLKKKRRPSRPASHPSRSVGPPGRGSLDLAIDGSVSGATMTFDVIPVPKERAQIVKSSKTGKVTAYTPARTRHFHKQIRSAVEAIMGEHEPIDGPVLVEMTFFMQIPDSWPKWKREAAAEGLIQPTSRPDMDNLEKALLDALNGAAFVDDALVIERRAFLRYAEIPGIQVAMQRTGRLGIHARRADVDQLRQILEEIEGA